MQADAIRSDAFPQLPDDIKDKILAHLPSGSVARAACTNRAWRDVCTRPVRWEVALRERQWTAPEDGRYHQAFSKRARDFREAWRAGHFHVASSHPPGPALVLADLQSFIVDAQQGVIERHALGGVVQSWPIASAYAMARAGNDVAVATYNGAIVIASFSTQEVVPLSGNSPGRITSLGASSDGRWVAAAYEANVARVWDTACNTIVGEVGITATERMRVLDDGRFVLAGVGRLFIGDAVGQCVETVDLSGHGHLFATTWGLNQFHVTSLRCGVRGGTLATYDLASRTHNILGTWPELADGARLAAPHLVALGDGGFVAAVGSRLARWDGQAFVAIRQDAPIGAIMQLAKHASGLVLVSGYVRADAWGGPWRLAAYDMSRQACIGHFDSPTGSHILGFWHDDHALVHTGSKIEVWQLR